MKKTLLMICAFLLLGESKLLADNYSIYYNEGGSFDNHQLCTLTDDDGDGVYTAIVNLADKSLLGWGTCQIQLFSGTEIATSWPNAIWAQTSEATAENTDVFSKESFTLVDNWQTDNKLAILIKDSDPDTYAVKIEYTADTKVIKFTKLIKFASSQHDWGNSTVYLEETAHGSKIFKNEINLNAGTEYKFVGNNDGGAGWYGKSDNSISTSGSNMTIAGAGVYEITADFSTMNYTEPDCKSIAVTATKEFSTFCNRNNLNFDGSEGLEAYRVSQVTESAAKMAQVTAVPAGQGLILKKTADIGSATIFQVPVVASAESIGDNSMVGVTSDTDMTSVANAYILKDGLFYECSGGTLAAGKAYLNAPAWAGSSASSFSMIFEDDTETNSISLPITSDDNSAMFNLAGQRVANDYKGIVIVNGKKMLNK